MEEEVRSLLLDSRNSQKILVYRDIALPPNRCDASKCALCAECPFQSICETHIHVTVYSEQETLRVLFCSRCDRNLWGRDTLYGVRFIRPRCESWAVGWVEKISGSWAAVRTAAQPKHSDATAVLPDLPTTFAQIFTQAYLPKIINDVSLRRYRYYQVYSLKLDFKLLRD